MLTFTRRSLVLGAMSATLFAAHTYPQAGWPKGTIKLVVPYPPGGSTDVIARLVQPCLQERLATTVIIENRRERHLLSKERLRDCRCWQVVGLA